MRDRTSPDDRIHGFALVDVLVAVLLLSLAAAGLAHLVSIAITANLTARRQTAAAILAAQKMEQLRALAWTWEDPRDGPAAPVSDRTTDLTIDPASAGGRGLGRAPSGTLDANTAGFVDYLDEAGMSVGTGPSPPEGTVYVRRWSVEPLASDPDHTLVLHVVTTTLEREARRAAGLPGRLPGDAWLVSIRSRRWPG
jgi:type II secretory pathway pseudopilin PulG